MDVPRERFEELVTEALDGLPPELGRLMDNVAVFVEDRPTPEQRDEYGPVLGLYEGIPLSERGSWYAGALPDRITIFREPICAACDDAEGVVAEVRITVVHEVAHHFGIDDERLAELGW